MPKRNLIIFLISNVYYGQNDNVRNNMINMWVPVKDGYEG